jgi:REP element-mobilizing transposase RayT
MARPLRIEYPNAYYHISNRAEDRKSVFPSDKYYETFLEGLADACARLNVEIHGYCLLRNEYHLLIKTPEGNLSRFMRQVDGLYTQHYQKLKKARGSVFKARYKAVLVQSENYLLGVSRYLHNLPRKVRVKPEDHQWSSLAIYLNKEKAPKYFNRDEVLVQLGEGPRKYSRYGAYVAEGVDAELSHFYGKKNLLSILGDDKFKKKVQAKSSPSTARGVSKGAQAKLRPSIKAVVEKVAEHFKVSEKGIYQAARGPGSKNLPRWVAMYLCQELSAVTLQVIAKRFGLKRYGTVSTTIGKLKLEFETNPKALSAVKKLSKSLVAS